MLTSKSNPRIKYLESLRKNSVRKKENQFVVEGQREISRAKNLKEVFYHEKSAFVKKLEKQGIDCVRVSEDLLEKITYRADMIAIAQKEEKTLKDLSGKFFLALVSIEKPGNLGAILRSCDGAGVDGILLCDSLVDHYHPNVIRGSLGAFFSLDIVSCKSSDAFAFIKKNKIKLVVTSPDAKESYFNKDLKYPLMLAMGSEDKGLDDSWLNFDSVNIPMKGVCDSLNVSVATGILLYEVMRQNES